MSKETLWEGQMWMNKDAVYYWKKCASYESSDGRRWALAFISPLTKLEIRLAISLVLHLGLQGYSENRLWVGRLLFLCKGTTSYVSRSLSPLSCLLKPSLVCICIFAHKHSCRWFWGVQIQIHSKIHWPYWDLQIEWSTSIVSLGMFSGKFGGSSILTLHSNPSCITW